MLGATNNATMTSQSGGSDVITCKRHCRTSSLDCLSLIVDSLATSVQRSSGLSASSFNSTTTASTIAWQKLIETCWRNGETNGYLAGYFLPYSDFSCKTVTALSEPTCCWVQLTAVCKRQYQSVSPASRWHFITKSTTCIRFFKNLPKLAKTILGYDHRPNLFHNIQLPSSLSSYRCQTTLLGKARFH